MSKFKQAAKKEVSQNRKYELQAVTNFMGGTSYNLNPVDTLRIIAASSIFGEPSYYRDSHDSDSYVKRIKNISTLCEYSIFADFFNTVKNATTTDVFTKAIDTALSHNFKATLDLAVSLRNEKFMRLNPAVIFIRAILHPNRVEFSKQYPGYLREVGRKIINRPDDITNQFEYFMYLMGSKNNLPSIVKRTWADKLNSYGAYHIKKYKSKSLIDLIRICHANSEIINELMKTGTVSVNDNEQTWETLRSAGKTWDEILRTINIPHMALLRNLRGIFTEINNSERAIEILEQLKQGVQNGKQFPFRYYSAYNAIKGAEVNHIGLIMDALEACMDIAVDNFPMLKGKTMSLCDNSGSAWGQVSSEYGTTYVAGIANLSAIITGTRTGEGEIGIFGDKLQIVPVSKRNGILKQLEAACAIGKGIGAGTENGIWLFFDKAIKEKLHYDNIFIYSDMQAGHGGLYGLNQREYSEYTHKHTRNIDVLKLVDIYRKTVNPKVNVFSVQVAGYNNNVLPENLYRGAILAGWTGNEVVYADEIIKIWNDVENIHSNDTKIVSSKQTAKLV